MAQIDVTELFTDPDFCDRMQVVKRTAAVNSFGENFIKEIALDGVGSIQPSSGKTIKRLPQALQNENVSSFWFKGEILNTDKCDYPSIIIFRGKRYQIRMVFDWNNWGAGWSEGVCVAENLT